MSRASRFFTGSPFNIALTYALFGGVWVFTTDRLILLLVDDPVLASQLQTAKGWVFVAVSSVVIYVLVLYSFQNLTKMNERLDEELQRSSILRRILRHNLRNSCNIIQGNIQAIQQNPSGDHEESLETIRTQNERLIDLSEKTKHLRNIRSNHTRSHTKLDLVDVITTQITKITDKYPDAEIQTDLPETIWVETDPRVDIAIYELLENAIEHNDSTPPTVTIGVQQQSNDAISLDIADDGPGMPEMERAVLEEGFEKPLFHSQGLGLWIARILTVNAGGSFRIVDNQPRGTNVRLTFPTSRDIA